jgi:Transglycosylase-like domain
MRSRSLVALAIAVVVVPAAAQAAESAADPPPGAAQADPQAIRDSVARLGHRAREHAARLGLRPAPLPAPAATTAGLRRQERRLRQVVAFLASRDELEQPVDERPAPRGLPRGPDVASRIRHQHRRATRLALALGLQRPRPLAPGTTRAERIAQLARWTAVARWLAARSERVTGRERPAAERVPHYEELTCIAEHESGGRWDIDTGNGYYGGLQMDVGFQQTYAPALYRDKGTADRWTPEEQMLAAGRAVEARGFSPWSTTARTCGLL